MDNVFVKILHEIMQLEGYDKIWIRFGFVSKIWIKTRYVTLNQVKIIEIIPSSIYSWSIGHILENEFFCLGRLGSQGSKEKKSGFEEF